MSMILKIAFLMTAISLGLTSRVCAQDSIQVVILSKRVGPEINALQREYFHLFPAFEGFQSARVIKTLDDKFEVRAMCLRKGAQLAEYVVEYPLATLLQMAEKINHFEDLESGVYIMGSDPAMLQLIRSKSSPPVEITRRVTEQMKTIMTKMAPLPGLKPEPPIDLESYPRLRFGAGISNYSPAADDVNSMLSKIEQASRDQGYPAGHKKFDLGLSMFYWFTLGVDITSDISVELEAGKAGDGDLSVKTATVAVMYYINQFRFAFVRPFAEIGVTNYYLEANQQYVYRAAKAPEANGGYWEFYSVTFSGKHAAAAPTFAAGLETNRTTGSIGLAMRVGVKYVNCPSMSVATQGGFTSALNMKRLSFGAHLFFYF